MKEKLSLIIVSGPNASGKTTLIEINEAYYKSKNFELILPDKILKYATSLTDRPAVIGEYIDDAITAKKNIVIETPFQNQEFMSRVQEIKKLGYETTLYQVFLDDITESINRVSDRFINGGLYIGDKEVADNYAANFKSISNIFYKFNHAYFIDNSAQKNFKLTASFRSGKLLQLEPSDSNYLKGLFKASARKELIGDVELKQILKNKDYRNPTIKKEDRG